VWMIKTSIVSILWIDVYGLAITGANNSLTTV
jgi:hypothetical protein